MSVPAVDKIIIGLGNPGSAYSWTRHNVGAEIVRYIATASNTALRRDRTLQAEVGVVTVSGRSILLAIPGTYMNVSGDAVQAIMKRNRIPLSSLLVVFDDLETRFGQHKLAFEGGARGHNGLRSIHQRLQSNAFFQLRFGIGRPAAGDIAEYVLDRFSETEKAQLSDGKIAQAIETIYTWMSDGAVLPPRSDSSKENCGKELK